MKVCIARAIALSVLLHGAAAAAVAMNSNRAVAFGPQNCVSLTRSDAGSCVLATDCGAADLSKTEFAFDCVGRDGIVRHSFGNGGFDSNEEFDTEVKCDRCDKISAEDVMATNVEKPAAEAAPVPPKPVQRATLKVEVPQAMPASVVFKAKSRQTVKTEAKAEKKAKVWPFSDKEWKQITGGSEKKDEAARYGPDGCVSTWKSPENHCIMQTKCKDVDISKYEFGLVCVDKVGSPVRHLFGKDSFDEEETFDTLIKCDQCLGLEDIPDAVALNGEVVTMSKDIANLKDVMKNISINVQMLNEEVFKTNAAPAPAGAAPAPAAAAKAEEKAPEKKSLIHHSTAHHNLRHSHRRHYEDDDDEDDDDDRADAVYAAPEQKSQYPVARDEEDDGDDED